MDLVEEEDVVVVGLAAVALAVVVDGEDVEEEALAAAVAADSDTVAITMCARSGAETRESEGSVRERESNNTCGVAV